MLPVEIERPYFYCRYCRSGTSPLDAALGLSAGLIQPDVQQAAADLATDLPYESASGMLERLSGIAVSSERIHTLTNQVAEGLRVLDVAPSRQVIAQRVAEVAAGRFRRPVLVLGIDGAYVSFSAGGRIRASPVCRHSDFKKRFRSWLSTILLLKAERPGLETGQA